MLSPSYIVRNFCTGDFEKYTDFYRNMNRFDQKESELPPGILMKKQRKPDYSVDKNLFVAEYKKKIVGFADITPEIKIERAVLCGLIHPLHRRMSLAEELIKRVLKRAEELRLRVIHVRISEQNDTARHFLNNLGFTPVRCFLELEIDLHEIGRTEPLPDLGDISFFKHGEEALLAGIQNTCFTGTWGFCPNTVEEINYYLNLTSSKLEDVQAARKGEKILGYCWTQMLEGDSQALIQEKGRIHMFGIDPEFQRRGLGKKLLSAGLDHLKEKGAKAVEITVDKENTVALSLYQSDGFNVKAVKLWYERFLVV